MLKSKDKVKTLKVTGDNSSLTRNPVRLTADFSAEKTEASEAVG